MTFRWPWYLMGIALSWGACLSEPTHPETCVTFAPPVLTRFTLISTTLEVSDSLLPANAGEAWSVAYDTLFVRREPQGLGSTLDVRTPAGDRVSMPAVGTGFVLQAEEDPVSGGYRLPAPGVYVVERLHVDYTSRACTNYYGVTTDTYASYEMNLGDLRRIGLEPDSFVVVHVLPTDSVTSAPPMLF